MSDNLKWLLLIPVIIVAILLGYVIPKLVGSDDGSSAKSQQNQALELDITEAQETVTSYQGLIDRNPADAEALRGIAEAYLQLGQLQSENNSVNESYVSFKSAIDNYRKYSALRPDDLEVKIEMGLLYSYLQMSEIAERELLAVTQAAPANQRAWLSYGYVLARSDKLTEAKAAWETANKIDPNTPSGQEARRFLDDLAAPQTPGTQVPGAP